MIATAALPRVQPRWRAQLRLLGPAFVAAVAYVDPGNIATNTSAGARYGYTLIWVIVLANAMAAIIQYLAAKLALATGKSLTELVRERTSRSVRLAYWAQAEVMAITTDVAEVVGGALAFQILLHWPLVVGGAVTGLVSMIILSARGKHRQQRFEQLIIALLAMIALGYGIGLLRAPMVLAGVAGGFIPHLAGRGSLLLVAGMVGATLMPHAVYVHSALVRDRHGKPTDVERTTQLLRATRWDVGSAMLLAGTINLAMLLLAAATLYGAGATDNLNGAFLGLKLGLGAGVAVLFALGLLVSSLASTAVGCHAGAVVMEDLLGRQVPLSVRRAITILPALVLLALGMEPTALPILSQVALSFCLPFALIPLVVLSSRASVMGSLRNSRRQTMLVSSITAMVVGLNLALITMQVFVR
jgi:manganese transport protein